MIRRLILIGIAALAAMLAVGAETDSARLAQPTLRAAGPWVFSGYRNRMHAKRYQDFPDANVLKRVWRDSVKPLHAIPLEIDQISLSEGRDSLIVSGKAARQSASREFPEVIDYTTPLWLRNAIDNERIIGDFMYGLMVANPNLIDYAYWDLPEPPRILEEDHSFRAYLKKNAASIPAISDDLRVKTERERTNWLHVCNIGLQLSQAYVSGNWYQGGNSYLAFLGNFLWDVQLNPVYHPKTLFQSTVSYKLAINSTPDDEYHRYSVSQDLFQYNLKAGYKAVNHWYYSFLMQFKTQMLRSYPANSLQRSASFLSPGELNLGLGMTYSKENAAKTLTFSASVSPVSYNMRTCIDPEIDHSQFGIKPDRKLVNEVGSNAEVNFMAKFWENVTYRTRLFLFTDYKTFQGDWENTLNFQFSKIFSTQIYAHLRYDSSADSSINRKWRKLMMKEILSVGISYTFSTK